MERIYYGFYDELKTLREDLEDNDLGFEFLENTSSSKKDILGRFIDAYDYLHGFCTTFAFCLHETFGYEMQAIYDDNGRLVHAYCVYEGKDEETIFIDIRGCTNDFNLFIAEFEDFITITEDEPVCIRKYKTSKKKESYIKAAEELLEMNKNYYDINKIN